VRNFVLNFQVFSQTFFFDIYKQKRLFQMSINSIKISEIFWKENSNLNNWRNCQVSTIYTVKYKLIKLNYI